MKYIDADKLKTELNKRIELLENGDAHSEVMKRVEGIIKSYKATLAIIDSLQQEKDIIIINKKDWEAQEQFKKNKDFGKPLQEKQPESSNDKFVFPSALYARTIDNKTIDVAYTPQSLDAVEYIKNDQSEHPEEDLKKELDEWMKYGPHKSYPWCTLPDIIKITAAHFYELGKNAGKA